MKKCARLLSALLVLTSLAARAELNLTGPVSQATGYFPMYYQDKNGLVLDLCLPSTGVELNQGLCLLLPADVPNPVQAISFPNNFPGEAFWFAADSSMPIGGGGSDATLVIAMEAAFANEEPVQGDQVVFGRIRFRFNAPSDGTYVITHPYGQKEVTASAGERVFFTDDLGVLCGLDFSCAANGHIGPFLRASTAAGGEPLDFVTVDGKQYLADPAVLTPVTGSPFGTNIFRIDGPNIGGEGIDFVETELFTLVGRVHSGPLPVNINIEKSTYSRSESGSLHIDVNAKAIKGLNQPDPQLKLFGKGMPGVSMAQSQPGFYYGQVGLGAHDVPSTVYITDLLESPGRMIPVNLVDAVTVKYARYNNQTNQLYVEAETSDKSNSGSGSPKLFAQGSDGSATVELDKDDKGDYSKFIHFTVPPAKIIVRSNRGGQGEMPVTTTGGGETAPTLVAEDDFGVMPTAPINVLVNDTDGTGQPITLPVQVKIVATPEHGTVVVNSDQSVNYTQRDTINGKDSFSYFITDTTGSLVSNVAVVNFDITDGNLPPIVNADTASVGAGASITIDALNNDSDADGDALVIQNVSNISESPVGTVTVVNNKVIFTAPVAGGPQQTLSYLVNDGHGHLVSGTITIDIDLPEIVNITLAEYRTSKSQWRIEGTDLPAKLGVVMTVYVGNTKLGTTGTDATGAWSYRANSALVQGTVKVVSSRGAQSTGLLTVRR